MSNVFRNSKSDGLSDNKRLIASIKNRRITLLEEKNKSLTKKGYKKIRNSMIGSKGGTRSPIKFSNINQGGLEHYRMSLNMSMKLGNVFGGARAKSSSRDANNKDLLEK